MSQLFSSLRLKELVIRPVCVSALLAAGLLLTWTDQLHAQQTCPCGIWGAAATPGPVANDGSAVELGVKFTSDSAGFVTGVRFYKYAQNTGTHVGNLWTASGTLLGTVTFANEGASGWQIASFASPIAVSANTTYVASYHTNVGFYAATQNGLAAAVDNAPLHALSSSAGGGNGVYQYGANSSFPNQTYLATNYWVDVVLSSSAPADTTPPTVLNTSPISGASGISTNTNVAVTFSEAMNASTISGSTIQLRDPANALVAATVTYSSATNTATLSPSAALAATSTYTLTVTGGAAGVQDLAGNPLAASFLSSFTTASGVGCPCSVWNTSTTPGPLANDISALELGMKFRADNNGFVSGVRYYKYAQNTGTHVGHLWSTAGALLGTVTFANESASGWQEASFAPPIAITANTTYVISYHTDTGFYAASNSFFSSGVDNGPLHALSNASAPNNGVYLYTAGSAFPNQTYQSSNYWVDVVFTTGATDTTPPTVVMTAPTNGTTVAGTIAVSANASDNVGVTSVQFKLDGANLGAADTASPYTVNLDTTPIANGTHALTAVASDAAGNTATATTVTVTVSNADTTPPTVAMTAPANGATVSGTTVTVSATAADNVGVAGVQFKLDGANLSAEDTASPFSLTWNSTTVADGSHTLTAVARDAAGNTATATTITVTVNNADATAPTVAMSAPANGATVSGTTVPVSATASDNVGVVGVQFKVDGANLGAEDTVSPYSVTWDSTTVANGSHTLTAVARDAAGNTATATIVTVTVSNADATPPSVAMTAPANGATVSGTTVTVSATAADNVGVAGVQFKLDGANLGAEDTVSPYSVTWDSTTVAGGSHTLTAVARDAAGNSATATPVTITVSNAGGGACPCSLWTLATTAGAMYSDSGSLELGVKFTSDVDGFVTGLRFYKYAQNTSTHIGNLWTVSGTLLGTVTFANETASGWQEQSFGAPIPVTANTTYVASYHTDTSVYAATPGGLASEVFTAPLHALASAAAGGNGVFLGGNTGFPNQTFGSTNYWVDLVFMPAADTTAPTVAMSAPANGGTVSGTTVIVSATASDNVGVAGVQFKLDGANLGAEDTVSPYSVTWNSTTVANGSHTLAAVARDAAGNTATATSLTVTVSNADTTPPTVSMTAPANGATVSGTTVTVSANASDNVGVAGVQFLLDGVATGSEVTVPPYAVVWNTTGSTNGVHTVAATARDAAGNTMTSTAVSVTVSNSASSGSALVLDVTASADRSSSASSISTGAFSTNGANELLLAFVSTDNISGSTTVTGVTGGSLTWQLVVRTNVQRGTAEVWRAFAPLPLGNTTVTATLSQSVSASITVVSFLGADATGANGSGAIGATRSANANPGAPSATLTTTRAGSWVFGVGNDWDHATARTVGSGQTMVHQFLSAVGDTYWVQRTNATTPAAGTSVTINDTAPSGDRYNLSLVEILPSTTPDVTSPSVVQTTPASGDIGVATTAVVTAKFSEAMDPATINAANIQLRDSNNVLVAASVAYDPLTAIATMSPGQPLSVSSLYTATVLTGVMDLAGNAMSSPASWSFSTSSGGGSGGGSQGSGGPILVVSSSANPFTLYYTEILRAEGLNGFAVKDISQVTSSLLSGYDLVVLGQQALTTSQVTMFTTWVQGGGKLIAMRPDKKLAPLLSLSSISSTLSNTYLSIDTSKAPGLGLVSEAIQFHGTADEYTTVDARVVATLYSDATHPTAFPAVTLNESAGSGQAAAFAFDLAQSVVYTRQGNPAWAGQERDGQTPRRSDDLFFGAKSGDFQPDWVDLTKVQIPQADEQQRLLANLILYMTNGGRPQLRFWYLPRGLKAAVLMSGDDHATNSNGPSARFNQYLSASTPGCVVANWECVRSTAYIYPNSPITNAQAAGFVAQGFEIGVHVTMDPAGSILCGNDFTASTLQSFYATRLAAFATAFPSLPAPKTHRMHCVMWSDWASQPLVEFQNGIRLDTSYYYWPDTWINNRPGLFTGSGMPMRFANIDGSMIDVYQAATQMTDESGQSYPLHIDTLLNNALGATGYYGVFAANMHTDVSDSPSATAIIASAKAHNVPVISAAQLLTWLDGRNNSSFGSMTWSSNVLTFSVSQAAGAAGLQVMVPTKSGTLTLSTVTLNGSSVSTTTQTIKGISYAFITVGSGTYRVTYAP